MYTLEEGGDEGMRSEVHVELSPCLNLGPIFLGSPAYLGNMQGPQNRNDVPFVLI